MNSKKILLFFLFLGIVLRFYLSGVATNRGDVLVHFDWARTIYKTGIKGSYSYPIWTYSHITQPPIMMLSFWVSRHLYENRFLLAQLHNQIRIPNAAFIIWFDKYGESILIRLWAIIGDIASSLFVYWIILKINKSKKLALLGFLLCFFNPISLFETCAWGQNDIYASIFILSSFLPLFSKNLKFLSPLIFILGILAKPTGLIIAPFYCFCFLLSFNFKKLSSALSSLFQIIISVILSLSITIYSFSLFVSSNLFNDIFWVITRRIANSSKGISLASVSAFNFYSLFFNIDKTYGSSKILSFTIDNLGIFLYILLNILALFLYLKYRNKFKEKYSLLIFLIYFIAQGSFLFMTSMLERYFMLAFVPSIVLMVIYFKKIGKNMIIQQIIWFLNLIYAFYWRDYGIIKTIFLGSGSLLIRILSLISLINFFLICQKMIKTKAS